MSDFWDWALKVYAAPQVAEACLELQDNHDQCVPLLLFGGWAEARGYGLDADTAEAAADMARAWSEQVIAPLRTIRRRIKGPVSDMETVAKDAIREQIKAAELAAEKALMSGLEGLIDPQSGAGKPSDNMPNLARQWAPVVPRAAINRLRSLLTDG
ncbi:MAG: TIGR02444 family protein [Asticcacaulis sp.]